MINIQASDLSDALARCKHSISNEETRYYLKGVHLRRTDDGVLFESTDGRRLTQTRVKVGDVPQFKDIIISRACVDEIRKNIKRKHHYQNASIDIDGASVTLPDAQVALELVDGTFPDCDRVIPRHVENPPAILLKREAFQRALAAMRGFAAANDATPVIKLSFADDKLTLSAKREDGEAHMICDCEAPGLRNGFEIGFNTGYLLDWVKSIESDFVKITVTDSGSPTLFSGVGRDDHALNVIMPCRV